MLIWELFIFSKFYCHFLVLIWQLLIFRLFYCHLLVLGWLVLCLCFILGFKNSYDTRTRDTSCQWCLFRINIDLQWNSIGSYIASVLCNFNSDWIKQKDWICSFGTANTGCRYVIFSPFFTSNSNYDLNLKCNLKINQNKQFEMHLKNNHWIWLNYRLNGAVWWNSRRNRAWTVKDMIDSNRVDIGNFGIFHLGLTYATLDMYLFRVIWATCACFN